MGILDIDVSNTPEMEPAPDGEHEVRITDVTEGTDKNGSPYLLPRFEVVGVDTAPDFTKFYGLPTKEMKAEDPKRHQRASLNLKKFFEAFGIDPSSPGDPQEWRGETAWAMLGTEVNEEFGDRNYIKRFITGA